MLSISDLRVGLFIEFNGQPHQVIWQEHSKQGRGGAIMRSKIKNLLTGAIVDYTFKGNEKIEDADISRSKAQFTYRDGQTFNFMNSQNFEQFELTQEQLGNTANFLKDGQDVDVLSWNNRPINVSPPIKIDLEVTDTEPGVRGNTAQGSVTKPAVLETGAKVNVPIFIKVGDIVKVNTETGEYVERVNKN